MAKRVRSKYLVLLAMASVMILAACSESSEQATSSPLPSATPEPTPVSVLATCGGPITRSSGTPLTALFPERDGYLWTLPDGTDANVSFSDILANDPNANETTMLSMPIWSQPRISSDLRRAAVTIQRRTFSSSADTRPLIVLSDAENPVNGLFVPPVDGGQALVTLEWLSESGCLAVLVFTPTHEQSLYVLEPDGDVVAQFQPKLGRGSVLDASGTGWIVLDRLAFVDGEIELFSVENIGTTIVVSAGSVVPAFTGLTGDGVTAEQFVESLRNRTGNG